MADKSKIEWTDATWNPIRGCSRVSEGCRNCYAERVAARFSGPGQPYEGLAIMKREPGEDSKGDPRWTGNVRLIESALDAPLHWKKPRKIFVNSMSDLFHEEVHDGSIDRIFAVMACSQQHTFQVLTKRPKRMRDYCESFPSMDGPEMSARVAVALGAMGYSFEVAAEAFHSINLWPLPNVWLGVSVEDQKTADERIPLLLNTPAAVRWVSYEPALGPVDLSEITWNKKDFGESQNDRGSNAWIDWLVCGGESGPGARPMHPDWARAARDQCQAAGVPFFFKQWGEWLSVDNWPINKNGRWYSTERAAGRLYRGMDAHGMRFVRAGKKAAGRQLDGREWNEFPR